MSFTFPAMGTTVEAWCPDPGQEVPLRSWFEEVESICSRFRDGSELSKINSSPIGWHDLSEVLSSIIQSAAMVRTLTFGTVDIGVGAAVTDWGYDRTFAEVSDLETRPPVADGPRWEIAGRRLNRSPLTKLDLGGIAKGWTCDRAVERGMAKVVSAGGDLRSADPDTTVSIADSNDDVVARVHLGHGALATSSTKKRRWQVAGEEVSHLINPTTMAPAESPIASASVIAASAVEAEAGAKAVVLHGSDGLAWADAQDWISAAIVIWHDGSVFATTGVQVAA